MIMLNDIFGIFLACFGVDKVALEPCWLTLMLLFLKT